MASVLWFMTTKALAYIWNLVLELEIRDILLLCFVLCVWKWNYECKLGASMCVQLLQVHS